MPLTHKRRLRLMARIFETVRKVKGKSVSNHAYYKLDGAIIDIERTGECDKTSLRTLKRVRSQLAKIGNLLDLYP